MKLRLFTVFLIMILSLLFVSCKEGKDKIPAHIFDGTNARFAIVISKKKFVLSVYDTDFKKVASYKVGYGLNPDMLPKLFQNDKRTPEGMYRIDEILSMDASRETESYRKIKYMNGVYFSSKAGYSKFNNPEADLGDNAYGPRFLSIDYPNEKDRERYSKALEKGEIPFEKGSPFAIGYGIAIHGNNDEASIGHLSSSGCVRMYNRDIVELDRFVEIGTPVFIY